MQKDGELQQDELHAKQTAATVHAAPGSQRGNRRHAAPAGSARALRLPLWAPNRQVHRVVGGGCWALLCTGGPAGGGGLRSRCSTACLIGSCMHEPCVCSVLAAKRPAPSAWRSSGDEGKRRQGRREETGCGAAAHARPSCRAHSGSIARHSQQGSRRGDERNASGRWRRVPELHRTIGLAFEGVPGSRPGRQVKMPRAPAPCAATSAEGSCVSNPWLSPDPKRIRGCDHIAAAPRHWASLPGPPRSLPPSMRFLAAAGQALRRLGTSGAAAALCGEGGRSQFRAAAAAAAAAAASRRSLAGLPRPAPEVPNLPPLPLSQSL